MHQPYPWSNSVSWCLAVGYGNRNECHVMGPRVSGNDFTTPAAISFGYKAHTEFILLLLCSIVPCIKYNTVKNSLLATSKATQKPAILYVYLTLGLLCLKNCRNFGMRTLSGRSRASESNSSAESSQIFCSAPNAPY